MQDVQAQPGPEQRTECAHAGVFAAAILGETCRQQMKVYRLQDENGRGPFKPGFTRYWAENRDRPLDIISAFGLSWRAEIPRGWAVGCACRSLQELDRWFSLTERERLFDMGYRIVALKPDMILREGDGQVIIARKLPFTRGHLPTTNNL